LENLNGTSKSTEADLAGFHLADSFGQIAVYLALELWRDGNPCHGHGFAYFHPSKQFLEESGKRITSTI
jgi:hypothetical protein